jgi:hypothetical protein
MEVPRLCRGGRKFDICGSRPPLGLSFREQPSTRKEFAVDDYESLSHTKWDCKYRQLARLRTDLAGRVDLLIRLVTAKDVGAGLRWISKNAEHP